MTPLIRRDARRYQPRQWGAATPCTEAQGRAAGLRDAASLGAALLSTKYLRSLERRRIAEVLLPVHNATRVPGSQCTSPVAQLPLCPDSPVHFSRREQPIFSTRAHVFQIDPATKRNWIPASKHALTVSYFYDATRNVYRIISVGGTKVGGILLTASHSLTAGFSAAKVCSGVDVFGVKLVSSQHGHSSVFTAGNGR